LDKKIVRLPFLKRTRYSNKKFFFLRKLTEFSISIFWDTLAFVFLVIFVVTQHGMGEGSPLLASFVVTPRARLCIAVLAHRDSSPPPVRQNALQVFYRSRHLLSTAEFSSLEFSTECMEQLPYAA
jgi:hypothetical protein